MKEDFTRRETMGAIAATGAGLLAGCSDQSQQNQSNQETDDLQDDQVTQEDTQEDTQESAETQDPVGEDFQYNGEQSIEEFILEEGNQSASSQYLELEHTPQQFNFPLEGSYNLSVDLENESFNGKDYGVLFISIEDEELSALESGNLEGDVSLFFNYLDPERYDESMGPLENMNQNDYAFAFEEETLSQDGLQTLFGSDILGYDDASEDFPQEYLDLIEE